MFHRLKKILLALPGFEPLCRSLTRGHVRTIMYHRFVGRDELGIEHMAIEDFERQIAYMVRHQTVISPDQHLAALRGEADLPTAPVVVTVDDGYRDFYELAFPVLRRYGAPSIFFPASGFVDGECWMWWDKLAHVFRNAPDGSHRLRAGDHTIDCVLDSRPSRLATWTRLSNLMIQLPVIQRDMVLSSLAEQLGVQIPTEPPVEYRSVGWSELKELADGGVTIGGHTVRHPILSRLEPEQARAEISDSRDQLAANLGEVPHIFCYPQGGPWDFTPQNKQMVIDAGFEACYVSFPDFDFSRDFHSLPRYASTSSWTQFRWVMCGGELFVLKLRKILHTVLRSKIPYWASWKPSWD